MRNLILLFTIFGFLYETQNNVKKFNEGLYYGKKGTAHIYITNKNDTAIAEVFVKIKGYVMNPLTDTLYRNKNTPNEIFIGNESVIFIKRNTYRIRQKKMITTQFKYRERTINFKPDKQEELNECRNRAYLYKKRDEIRHLIGNQIKDSAISKATNFYYNSLYDYSIDNLARSLPHEEFIKRYAEIREKIMREIIENYNK